MSLRGSYYWNGAPTMRADISYSQTARTASTATYSVTVALYFTSGGWFGYGLVGTVSINGATQSITFKNASPTWSGAGHKGTWTFNITASAGTGGGTLPASFRMLGQQGDNTDINTGSRTVSLSTWNTAPEWTGEGNVNGWSSSQIIPENTTTVTVNLPSASDREGNTIWTDVARYVNGGRDKTVAGGTSARSVTDNVSAIAQGAKFKYSFYMSDGSLYNPTTKYTIEHTKNKFTPATISANGAKIWYSTTEFSCSVGAATNLHSDRTFTYTISTNIGIKVYNPTVSGNFTLKVHKSGTAPSTPYILFSDLMDYYRTRGWSGSFNLIITSSNKFGSSGTNSTNVLVDLKVDPAPAVINTPTGTTTVKGAAYYIPKLAAIGISWAAATDKLSAGAITYRVHHKIGSNGWQLLSTTSGTSVTVPLETLANISEQTSYSIKVEATTVYGTSAMSAEKTITLHYYNTPKVYFTDYYRTESEFSVNVHTSVNTSIPTVAIVRRYWTHTEGSGDFAGSPYTYSLTGLTGGTNMWLIFEAYDDSGIDLGWGAGRGSEETATGIYTPIMTMTDEGVYINIDPDSPKVSKRTLNVGGSFNGHGVYDYDTRVYSPMNKPSGSEIPYIPINGGTVTGNLTMGSGVRLVTSNNYGVLGALSDGSAAYMLYMGTDNRIKIGHGGRGLDVQGRLNLTDVTDFKKMVNIFGGNGTSHDEMWINMTNNAGKSRVSFTTGSNGDGLRTHIYDNNGKWLDCHDLVVGDFKISGRSIVGRGSNGNGHWTKYYDGTLICRRVYYYSSFACTTQYGSVYYGSSDGWVFPHEFYDTPDVIASIESGGSCRFVNTAVTSKTGFNAMVSSSVSHGGGFYFHYIAIGRWK